MKVFKYNIDTLKVWSEKPRSIAYMAICFFIYATYYYFGGNYKLAIGSAALALVIGVQAYLAMKKNKVKDSADN